MKMTVQQAYKAGFLLQCAHLGVQAAAAEALFQKQAFLGTALGAATNVGLQAGRGALTGVSGAMDMAGGLGDNVYRAKLDEELKTPHLPAVRNMIVAEHYRRALRALQEAKGVQ